MVNQDRENADVLEILHRSAANERPLSTFQIACRGDSSTGWGSELQYTRAGRGRPFHSDAAHPGLRVGLLVFGFIAKLDFRKFGVDTR